jgi:bifunctional UDP-N-acetylglucosamine pyrophosphorylase/glucosamine-1-phosphate N-acetyltransferase
LSDLHIVILAAGKGTRMKSSRPKVLHSIAGAPMIDYVLEAAGRLHPRSTAVVVGHQAEVVAAALAGRPGLTVVVQEPQAGTAHALLTTQGLLGKASGVLLLLSGDVPLLSATTLKSLVEHHLSANAAATVVTAVVEDPRGYGRIIRSGEQIAHIVEDKDASSAERGIQEINAGIYAFRLQGLYETVKDISAQNAQGEHYLPDLVALYRKRGLRVETFTVANPDEIRGINSRVELAAASRLVRLAKNTALMESGVTLEDPATTYVDRDVTVGADTVIHPCVFLEGRTTIGAGCEIHSGARIVNSQIGDRVTVYNHCVIEDSAIANDASVGPFARLRKDARIGPHAKVGNFVEVKKTTIGTKSKAMHLSYIGDAIVGEGVNIGAGTITCNYDGTAKHQTTIESGAFIGSDSQLIAPVTVGKDAYVGTGTTIREDVPPGALAVSAGKQRNIEGWVEKKLKRKK